MTGFDELFNTTKDLSGLSQYVIVVTMVLFYQAAKT